jgi:hypothetical protein
MVQISQPYYVICLRPLHNSVVIRHIALAIEIFAKAIELRPSTLSSRTPQAPPSYVCAYSTWSCDITTPDSALRMCQILAH